MPKSHSPAILLLVVAFDVLSVQAFILENDALSLLQDQTQGPVEKVGKLLGDIKDQLEKDADDDAALHEEYDCWCKSTNKKRSKLISDNTEKAAALTNQIEGLRAKSTRLNTEIEGITTEVNDNQKALDTAVTMRKKNMAEFNANEKSAVSSINELNGAEAALKKLMPNAMMQSEVSLDSASPVVAALKNSMLGHHDVLWSLHNEREQKIMRSLLSHSRDLGLLQGATPGTHNAAPYQIIHGTISSLNEAFKENLKSLQDKENDDQAAHEALKTTKTDQIRAGVSMLDAKTNELADTDQQAAAARTELDDVNSDITADTEYLAKVVEQCKLHDKEHAQRLKTRQEEISAVSQALVIVTSDSARDMFTKALGHSKRPEEGQLGSRLLKEFKEERDTQSMRSQTNAARKAMWGSAERYLLLQQHSKIQHQRQHSSAAAPAHPHEAQKLATLAARTEMFWKANLYNEDLKANTTKIAKHTKSISQHASTAKKQPEPPQHKNKLGLTASQMKLRGNKMSKAAEGVLKMRESLEMQQGEEQARKTWCVEEIHQTEKAIDNKVREKETSETIIKNLDVRGAQLKEEIKQLGYEQEDADIELAKAGIDRKKADEIFQKTVATQKESKNILKMALEVLQSFYDRKGKKASLLRQSSDVQSSKQHEVEAVRAAAGALYGDDDSFSFAAARDQELHHGVLGRPSAAFVQRPMVVNDQLSFSAARDWELAHLQQKASLLQGSGSQKAKSITPSAAVTKILEHASEEAADGEDLIAKGLALAKAQAAARPAKKAMLQAPEERAPPPSNFKEYKDGAASGGLLTMIQGLMEDLDAMVEEAVSDESDSMQAYEEYVKASNAAKRKVLEAILNRKLELAKLEESAVVEKQKLKEIIFERNELRQYDIDLYGVEGCAYLLKNYIARFVERVEEINSLKEAEAILGVTQRNPTKADEKVEKELEPAGEEEEPEEAPEQGPSEMKAVPEGVQIEGPNGEKAVAKMASR
jgi:hypothetical protein